MIDDHVYYSIGIYQQPQFQKEMYVWIDMCQKRLTIYQGKKLCILIPDVKANTHKSVRKQVYSNRDCSKYI